MVDELGLVGGGFLLVRFAKRVLDLSVVTLMDGGKGKSNLCLIYEEASDWKCVHCC
jgi:hypothetical protein